MTVHIYACGGTGVNIGKLVAAPGAVVHYIDTSVSNLKSLGSPNIFLVEDMDGAGKNRSVAYENFKDISEDVLVRFKPSEQLNIVVGSLSGGSGSIIAPLLTKELLKKGHNVVVVALDSQTSVIEISNAQKTLKTYKSISETIDKPVSLFYIENTIRAEADNRALKLISLMSLLVDKQATEEFDNSDLRSFLYFNRVTDNPATVSILQVTPNKDNDVEKGTSVVGSLLITRDRSVRLSLPIPEYLATCVVTDDSYKSEDIRLDSVLGKLSLVLDELEEKIKTLQDRKRVNKVREVEISDGNSDGIVL
jgi:hypothetical protein